MSRETVLKIACLEESERNWLMNQLSPAERAYYEPLLQEVLELGLQSDAAVLSLVSDAPSASDLDALIVSLGFDFRRLPEIDRRWQSMLLSGVNRDMAEVLIERLHLPISADDGNVEVPPALFRAIAKAVSNDGTDGGNS